MQRAGQGTQRDYRVIYHRGPVPEARRADRASVSAAYITLMLANLGIFFGVVLMVLGGVGTLPEIAGEERVGMAFALAVFAGMTAAILGMALPAFRRRLRESRTPGLAGATVTSVAVIGFVASLAIWFGMNTTGL